MAQYRDLNQSPAQSMAEIVMALKNRADSSNTTAAGVKDMGLTGDITWTKFEDDGTGAEVEMSMRELDFTMEATREQLAQAVLDLAELNNVTLPELQEELGKLGDLPDIDWNSIDFDNIGRVVTEGPPPTNPTIGQTLWVAPNGRVFRAIECEDGA